MLFGKVVFVDLFQICQWMVDGGEQVEFSMFGDCCYVQFWWVVWLCGEQVEGGVVVVDLGDYVLVFGDQVFEFQFRVMFVQFGQVCFVVC